MRWREAGDQYAAEAQGDPCSLLDLLQHQSHIRHEQPEDRLKKQINTVDTNPVDCTSLSLGPTTGNPGVLFYAHVLNTIPWMLGLKHLSDLFWRNKTSESHGSKHQIGLKSVLGQRIHLAWLYQTHRALQKQGSPAPTSQTSELSLLTRTLYLDLQVTC